MEVLFVVYQHLITIALCHHTLQILRMPLATCKRKKHAEIISSSVSNQTILQRIVARCNRVHICGVAVAVNVLSTAQTYSYTLAYQSCAQFIYDWSVNTVSFLCCSSFGTASITWSYCYILNSLWWFNLNGTCTFLCEMFMCLCFCMCANLNVNRKKWPSV